MPPSKRDSLSADVADFTRINGVLCEIACYGSETDYLCRITEQKPKPTATDMTDGYCPPPDAGLLWIRSFDNRCMVSGFIREHIAPNSTLLDELLEQIQGMLTVDQVQPVLNVEVIGSTRTWSRCFNGEQIDESY